MRSLLKRKSDAGAASATPPWHPNFRNFQRLPDTKVVRTAFFVNGLAIVVASVLALWFAYQEYELRELRQQVSEWQTQIDRENPVSRRAIAEFKKFQSQAAKVAEVDAFLKARPLISDLLIQLGQTLPSNIAIDGFDLRGSNLRLIASVRGAPEMASGHASTYLTQLRANPALAEWFDDIALLNINRNPQTGRLVVEYSLKQTPALTAKKGKR